jgi:AhpC/TSA family/Disulphide bond corrector protein DsbC
MTLPTLKSLGINAAAVTFDSREILWNFAETYKIDYPLLSDEGSDVIRAFGILNTNIPEDHKMMYGMPWPGDYLIAPDRTVRDKLFDRDYQYRPSASAIVIRHFNLMQANSVELETDWLSATVGLSTDRCFAGQDLTSQLSIQLKPGWHIYGEPLPPSYQPTRLNFSGPLVGEQSLELPSAKPMMLAAIGEALPVFEDQLTAFGKLQIRWSPPVPVKFLESFGSFIEPGDYKISGQLKFQACSAKTCEPPQAIDFELRIKIETPIPPASRDRTKQ